ncbi:DinB family protein [Kribbella jejuensis]|uniref:Pentapeptide repeat protein n=1 Tax=Kribbella jejuensis TaxID=236068 RepID=A0A542EV30_9ACTN|nr:DinB family protein [Kribbella jejuensis]TQJ19200.1 pentapeptide repeat protein [Kribbella jejuensis]
MAKFGPSDELQAAEFTEANLKGARFVECDLSGVVMRGVDIHGTDIDAPWLAEPGASLKINGVEVAPYVQAELDRQFPGRADRRAEDPEGLRAAWAAVERAWASALDRVATMPEGTVDLSVDGEWSWAQTQRHLIHATDIWFAKAILDREQPFHPYGVAHTGGTDPSQPGTGQPSYAEVLEVRAGHQAMVRDYLATVTAADLDTPRQNPHGDSNPETTRSCLHVILEEEWEHLRFATRDLATLTARTEA